MVRNDEVVGSIPTSSTMFSITCGESDCGSRTKTYRFVWGTLTAAAITVIIGGLYISTGFGYLFDFAFCILFAALVIPLIALIVALLLKLFRKFPPLATGSILGSSMIVMALWGLLGPPELGASMAIGIGLATGFLGATIATFFWGNFGQSTLRKKLVVAVLFLLSLSGSGYFIFLFAHEGSLDKLLTWKPPADSMPAKLSAPDPSAKGPLAPDPTSDCPAPCGLSVRESHAAGAASPLQTSSARKTSSLLRCQPISVRLDDRQSASPIEQTRTQHQSPANCVRQRLGVPFVFLIEGQLLSQKRVLGYLPGRSDLRRSVWPG